MSGRLSGVLAGRPADRDLGSDLRHWQRTHFEGHRDWRWLRLPPLEFLIDQDLKLLVGQAGEEGIAVDIPRRRQVILKPGIGDMEVGVDLLQPPDFLARKYLRDLARSSWASAKSARARRSASSWRPRTASSTRRASAASTGDDSLCLDDLR